MLGNQCAIQAIVERGGQRTNLSDIARGRPTQPLSRSSWSHCTRTTKSTQSSTPPGRTFKRRVLRSAASVHVWHKIVVAFNGFFSSFIHDQVVKIANQRIDQLCAFRQFVLGCIKTKHIRLVFRDFFKIFRTILAHSQTTYYYN